MKKILSFSLLLVLMLSLMACGGSTTNPTSAPSTNATSAPAPSGGASKLTVDTAAGAALAYAETNLEATAGDIEVTFNNKGALEHNWVVVKPGDEQKAVDEALSNAPSFLPKTSLGMGKTLAAGQSETFTVNLQPGTYSYICTFPGHYQGGMKGTLVVK